MSTVENRIAGADQLMQLSSRLLAGSGDDPVLHAITLALQATTEAALAATAALVQLAARLDQAETVNIPTAAAPQPAPLELSAPPEPPPAAPAGHRVSPAEPNVTIAEGTPGWLLVRCPEGCDDLLNLYPWQQHEHRMPLCVSEQCWSQPHGHQSKVNISRYVGDECLAEKCEHAKYQHAHWFHSDQPDIPGDVVWLVPAPAAATA